MTLESYLRKTLNESIEDDDYASVEEIYTDSDDTDEPEWTEAFSKMESVKRVRVVRRGVPTCIARSTRVGFKVINKEGAGPEERRMSFAERRARERAAERCYVARKKWQSDKLQAQRKESLAKRKDFNIEK
jgi:hypothetical protein